MCVRLKRRNGKKKKCCRVHPHWSAANKLILQVQLAQLIVCTRCVKSLKHIQYVHLYLYRKNAVAWSDAYLSFFHVSILFNLFQ